MTFIDFAGGMVSCGADPADGPEFDAFCFDNECPEHQVLLRPYQMANRCVTNGEYLAFIEDGGYQQPSLWLAEGWNVVQERAWQSPLYWVRSGDSWFEYRLDGLQPLALNLPVVHLSGHEAFAFATWCGARLPTEFEWEHAAQSACLSVGMVGKGAPGNFVESQRYHPAAATDAGVSQMYGDVWEWTASSYAPYPGFRPLPGTLGEYNGKFMSSQLVLRGGSCATPASHIRATYRNFFYPPDRWQFTGLRLAKDLL